jgi:hypothetical protein
VLGIGAFGIEKQDLVHHGLKRIFNVPGCLEEERLRHKNQGTRFKE